MTEPLTPAELDAIVQRHKWASPHIKERQTWKDTEALLADNERLRVEVERVTKESAEAHQLLHESTEELRLTFEAAKDKIERQQNEIDALRDEHN